MLPRNTRIFKYPEVNGPKIIPTLISGLEKLDEEGKEKENERAAIKVLRSERRERRVAPRTLGRDVHILKAFQAPKTEDGSSLKDAFTFKKHPGKSKPSGGIIHVFTHAPDAGGLQKRIRSSTKFSMPTWKLSTQEGACSPQAVTWSRHCRCYTVGSGPALPQRICSAMI